MAVILQYGRPRSRRTIEERLSGPVFDDLIVIVPTRRRIRHLVREVMALTGRPVTPAFPFFTLETFARSLYASTDAPRRIVAGPLQTLLFHLAVRSEQDNFSYFVPRAPGERMFTGTFEKVIEVVLHLKENGILPEVLRQESGIAPLDEQHKLNDVARIYEAYEASLLSLRATDIAGIFHYFHRECSPQSFLKVFRGLHPSANLLTLSGFDEFSLPELGLIRRLTEIPGLSVNLLFDYQHGNPALFGHLEENYRSFREMGFVPVRETVPRTQSLFPVNTMSRSPRSRAAADALAGSLFLADHPAAKMDLQESITLMSAVSRRQEVVLICKLIKHLAARHPGLDLASVCVAAVRPQLYTDLFREECARFGIPANITDRFQLSRSPLVSALLALLRIPLAGYRREDILRTASAPYFAFLPGEVGLSVGLLSRLSAELRITGGERTWENRLQRRRDREAELLPGEADQREMRRRKRSVAELDRAMVELTALRSVLGEISRPCTPRIFQRRFLALASRLEIVRNLMAALRNGGGEIVERDARAYTRFLEAVEECARLAEFEHGSETSHPLSFYLERLTTAVLRERFNVREQFGRGVLVTSIDETRGLSMRFMIVAGLVDGEFPSVYQPEVFLSAERRSEREKHALWQNRYLFYQAASNWTEHLYLTYPRREGEVDLVRSSFIDALKSVAVIGEGGEGDGFSFEETLASEEEVLQWCSAHPVASLPAELAGDGAFASQLEAVREAAAVERSRIGDHRLEEFEGMVGRSLSGTSRAVLESIRDRAFSVSQLETYRRCPFKFLAQRLLFLEPTAELEESITPLERGAILHDALFEFFVRRRDGGLPPIQRCTDGQFEAAVEELAGLVGKRLDLLDVVDPFWEVERELLLGRPGSPGGLVREFLETERSRDTQTLPEYFEVAFGDVGGPAVPRDHLLSTPEPVLVGGLRLRGKIDRIEIGEGFYSVVDYKTGKVTPKLDEIRKGLSLQLPVYLQVAQRLLESAGNGDLVPAAGLYYSLRSPVRPVPGLASGRFNGLAYRAGAASKQVLKTDEDLRQLIEFATGLLGETVREIAEGKFPLTSPENVEAFCSRCDYRTMCRIQSLRHVQPKPPEES